MVQFPLILGVNVVLDCDLFQWRWYCVKFVELLDHAQGRRLLKLHLHLQLQDGLSKVVGEQAGLPVLEIYAHAFIEFFSIYLTCEEYQISHSLENLIKIEKKKQISLLSEIINQGYRWISVQQYSLLYQMGSKGSRSRSDKQEEDIPVSVQQAKSISPRIHKITKQIIAHCHSEQYDRIEEELKNISYTFPESPFSLCLQKNTEFYSCPQCYGKQTLICKECFDMEQHKGHIYEFVETTKVQICPCGNSEVRELPIYCPKHKGKSVVMESEEEMIVFKKEIKFLFNLAISIRNQTDLFKITPANLSTLGSTLLKLVYSLARNSNTISKLTQQILLDRPDKIDPNDKRENLGTIFQEMVAYAPDHSQITTTLGSLVQCMVKTESKKEGLISIMIKYLFNSDEVSQSIVTFITKSRLTVQSFPKSFEDFFCKISEFCFTMPALDTNNLDYVLKRYNLLTQFLFSLLRHPNNAPIFISILQHTKLEGLLKFERYYLENNQANDQINKMGLYYTVLLEKVIPIIAKSPGNRSFLYELLKECYSLISRRETQTFNRVFERLFASLAFELFHHSLPTRQQLQDIIGAIDYHTVSKVVLDFIHFKVIFENEYKQIIINCDIEEPNQNGHVSQMRIVALDQFFFKIFVNLVEKHEVQLIYQGYIQEKVGELLSMNQFQHKNIREYLLKLSQFLQVLVTSLPSSMPEMILSANSEQLSKDGEIILSNLLYIMENKNSAEYKKEAQKFIENEELIISFIKREAVVENKKIRYRGQDLPLVICLAPDCEYLQEDMVFQHYERVVANRKKVQNNEFYERFFQESSLEKFIDIYKKCTVVVSQPDFEHKKYQKEIILAVETLCNLFTLNKSEVLFGLIERLSKKITIPPARLQAYFKSIFHKEMVDEKEQAKNQSEKKKKKLQQIKQQQQKALSAFKVEGETKINLECIFCKNSREGEPYLLAHFRYNNFYSKKILQMDAPFMEFTTCGHSAHETCLTEMHKGEFRIWYPCILCKSITNILLPYSSSSLKDEQRFQKILDFLKNFAATYTFFFQNRKELVEFGLDQIGGVYKLLFKTIIYSLTIYPIVNHSYFIQNQFPILKFIFDLLKFTHKKVKNLSFCADYQLKVDNELSSIFHYHRYQLEFLIINNFSNMALQRKIDEYRDQFSEELTELFDQIYQNLNDQKDGFDCELKDQSCRNIIKGLIFKPPNDLNELRNLKKTCRSCEKQDENFQICLLCEWSCCGKCIDVRKVHAVEEHIGETVFINGHTGKICYIHEELTGDFSSVYMDYLGHQAQNKKNIGAEQYSLNQTSWSKIVNDIVCNRLHKEVMRLKG